MRRTKKQLLGLAGLAVVGVMTAVAYCLPAPGAAAAEDGEVPPSTSNGTSVVVTVRSDAKNYVHINSPANGTTIEEPEFTVNYLAQETDQVNTYLEYTRDNKVVRKLVDTFTTSSNYQTNNVDINLTNYGGVSGQYKVIVESRDMNNMINEDSVTVNYRVMKPSIEYMPAKNGDPILDATINSTVNRLVVRAYDSNNKLLFVDANGQDAPIVLGRDAINPTTGMITKVLPFSDYKAAAGKYHIVVVAQDADGDSISMGTIAITYDPAHPENPVLPYDPNDPTDPNHPDNPNNSNKPDVPNTGSNLSDLNISKIDYLITGLVVFGLVSVFAVYLVMRKSRR